MACLPLQTVGLFIKRIRWQFSSLRVATMYGLVIQEAISTVVSMKVLMNIGLSIGNSQSMTSLMILSKILTSFEKRRVFKRLDSLDMDMVPLKC